MYIYIFIHIQYCRRHSPHAWLNICQHTDKFPDGPASKVAHRGSSHNKPCAMSQHSIGISSNVASLLNVRKEPHMGVSIVMGDPQ